MTETHPLMLVKEWQVLDQVQQTFRPSPLLLSTDQQAKAARPNINASGAIVTERQGRELG